MDNIGDEYNKQCDVHDKSWGLDCAWGLVYEGWTVIEVPHSFFESLQ